MTEKFVYEYAGKVYEFGGTPMVEVIIFDILFAIAIVAVIAMTAQMIWGVITKIRDFIHKRYNKEPMSYIWHGRIYRRG